MVKNLWEIENSCNVVAFVTRCARYHLATRINFIFIFFSPSLYSYEYVLYLLVLPSDDEDERKLPTSVTTIKFFLSLRWIFRHDESLTFSKMMHFQPIGSFQLSLVKFQTNPNAVESSIRDSKEAIKIVFIRNSRLSGCDKGNANVGSFALMWKYYFSLALLNAVRRYFLVKTIYPNSW